MHYGKITCIISLVGILAACTTMSPGPSSGAQSSSSSKVVASSVQPAQIPADLSTTNMQNTYAVPGATVEQAAITPTTATPPGSNLAPVKPVATAPTPAAVSTTSTQDSIIAAEAATINGRIGLSVQMPYQQAWTQVGKALPKAGYPVMEQDAQSGTYYIVDKVGSGGVIQRDTPIYQLHLQKAGDNKTIGTLINSQNQPADTAVSQRILGAVKRSI